MAGRLSLLRLGFGRSTTGRPLSLSRLVHGRETVTFKVRFWQVYYRETTVTLRLVCGRSTTVRPLSL